jgi:hypothetical protein
MLLIANEISLTFPRRKLIFLRKIAPHHKTRKIHMTLKRPKGPAGTLIVLEHTSKILRDNPLGDPHVRKLAAWLPPQYDEVGKSSGGYGAILHGMKCAKYWGAIADHSGDAYFDFVYWHDWPNTLNELAKHRMPKRKPGAYDARRESNRVQRGPSF